MKIPAAPETVKNLFEDPDLNFHKYNKFKCTKERIIDPSLLHSLMKSSECMSYDNKYTFYDLKMALWSHKRVHGLD